MSRHSDGSSPWLAGTILGGAALTGGVLLALSVWPRTPVPRGLPSDDWQTTPVFTEADVEAAARMLASENPRGSHTLHVELLHTQLRSRKPGQALFERITAGSGFGPQGERVPPGGTRPVSTAEPATPALRQLTREVLAGLHPSLFQTARKFFEPAAQDRALAVAVRARQKQAAGLPLSKQELRLLHYRRSADEVRAKWLAEGAVYVGTLDGTEFFT